MLLVTHNGHAHSSTKEVKFTLVCLILGYNTILGEGHVAHLPNHHTFIPSVHQVPHNGGGGHWSKVTKESARVLHELNGEVLEVTQEWDDPPHMEGQVLPWPELAFEMESISLTRRVVWIGYHLTTKFHEVPTHLLWRNENLFAWELNNLRGVSNEVVEHHLNIRTKACPIWKKLRPLIRTHRRDAWRWLSYEWSVSFDQFGTLGGWQMWPL